MKHTGNQSPQHHGKRHRPEFPGWGDDDGDKHAVDGDTQGASHGFRQNTGGGRPQESPKGPAQIRGGDQPRQIIGPYFSFMLHSYRKYFVRIAKREHAPLPHAHLGVNLLRQGKRHQHIPDIDHKRSDGDFHIHRPGKDQFRPGKLPRRGKVGHGDQHGKPYRHTVFRDHHPKRKGNGHIPQANRHAVPQASDKRGPSR